ncbi:unnamed protein product [Calypogeia fissa]
MMMSAEGMSQGFWQSAEHGITQVGAIGGMLSFRPAFREQQGKDLNGDSGEKNSNHQPEGARKMAQNLTMDTDALKELQKLKAVHTERIERIKAAHRAEIHAQWENH